MAALRTEPRHQPDGCRLDGWEKGSNLLHAWWRWPSDPLDHGGRDTPDRHRHHPPSRRPWQVFSQWSWQHVIFGLVIRERLSRVVDAGRSTRRFGDGKRTRLHFIVLAHGRASLASRPRASPEWRDRKLSLGVDKRDENSNPQRLIG